MHINLDDYNISRYEWEDLIDKWIFNERNRKILKRKLLDGHTFEAVAEEFDLEVRHVQNIVYKSHDKLLKRWEASQRKANN